MGQAHLLHRPKPMADSVAVVGPSPHRADLLGVFKKCSELVNGRPSYVKADDPNFMIWHCNEWWFIGKISSQGQAEGAFNLMSEKPLEESEGTWEVADGMDDWLDAPGVKVFLPRKPAADDEVAVTGERTFAQRDAESRKRAIDLEDETPRKRGRAATSEMEERVAKARSVCSAAVDKRVRELAQPALDDYMADKIDEPELKRRKAEARKKAAAEHKPLATLDAAFAAYTATRRRWRRARRRTRLHKGGGGGGRGGGQAGGGAAGARAGAGRAVGRGQDGVGVAGAGWWFMYYSMYSLAACPGVEIERESARRPCSL